MAAIPLYGDGLNERDWLYVDDHCSGVHLVLHEGLARRDLQHRGRQRDARTACSSTRSSPCSARTSPRVDYVEDRLGHDRRYSVDIAKITALGWRKQRTLDEALEATVEWYRANEWWWRPLKSDR